MHSWVPPPPHWLSSVENCFQMPELELVKSQHVDWLLKNHFPPFFLLLRAPAQRHNQHYQLGRMGWAPSGPHWLSLSYLSGGLSNGWWGARPVSRYCGVNKETQVRGWNSQSFPRAVLCLYHSPSLYMPLKFAETTMVSLLRTAFTCGKWFRACWSEERWLLYGKVSLCILRCICAGTSYLNKFWFQGRGCPHVRETVDLLLLVSCSPFNCPLFSPSRFSSRAQEGPLSAHPSALKSWRVVLYAGPGGGPAGVGAAAVHARGPLCTG